MDTDRRNFIKKSSLLAGGLTLGLTQSCSPFKLAEHTIQADRIAINKSQFGEDPYLVIKVKNIKAPIYISKVENSYSALLMECTHKQCTVRPVGTILRCPCHGSEFDNQGKVLESPAESNLKPFRITHDEEYVYVY